VNLHESSNEMTCSWACLTKLLVTDNTEPTTPIQSCHHPCLTQWSIQVRLCSQQYLNGKPMRSLYYFSPQYYLIENQASTLGYLFGAENNCWFHYAVWTFRLQLRHVAYSIPRTEVSLAGLQPTHPIMLAA
jgi:hypothetical protein